MASWQSQAIKIFFRIQRFRGRGEFGIDVAAERERHEGLLARLKPAVGATFIDTGLAEKAQAAGVDVKLEVWAGMYHVWQMNSMIVPEGRQALKGIGRFLDGVLGS